MRRTVRTIVIKAVAIKQPFDLMRGRIRVNDARQVRLFAFVQHTASVDDQFHFRFIYDNVAVEALSVVRQCLHTHKYCTACASARSNRAHIYAIKSNRKRTSRTPCKVCTMQTYSKRRAATLCVSPTAVSCSRPDTRDIAYDRPPPE